MSVLDNIKTNLANRKNYGNIRSSGDIKFIVIHYTANDGDTDENNGKYFANNVVKSSAHYFVDDDSITCSVPETHVAWHCGGTTNYKHSTCRNANSIGIELCDDVKNGTIYPSALTIENALELTKMLMKKYNIPASNVIRHYDVTGKLCPAYWCGDSVKNALWKTAFWNKLNISTNAHDTESKLTVKVEPAREYSKLQAKKYTVTASVLNMRRGAGTSKGIIKTLKQGEQFTCYGYYTNNGGTIWILGLDKDGNMGYCSKKYLK